MRTVILGVETQSDLTRRILATAHGQRKAGDDRISFESVSDLWRVLAPKRMEIKRDGRSAPSISGDARSGLRS
jgi:predicted transcriptional regulator